MIARLLQRIFGNVVHNEQLIDKLAETKAIKRAAQLTAYYLVKATDVAQKKMIEYERSSDGIKKLSQVVKEITNETLKKK